MKEASKINCQDSEAWISALYDGEPVPPQTADHINGCANCRERLRIYSTMGAELRLQASRAAATTNADSPYIPKPFRQQGWFASAKGSVNVPKFVIVSIAALFLVITANFLTLHAQQNRPLWFQFSLDPRNPHTVDQAFLQQHAVQAGYDDIWIWGDSPTDVVGTHVAISKIDADSVQLAIRSRRYQAMDADQVDAKHQLSDLTGHLFTYQPGTPLQIPIEGGGTTILKGQILDHQPKSMMFGIPLEPDPNQLVVSSPVLISGNTVLFNLQGANTIARGGDEVAVLYVPGVGLLRFTLEPWGDAVQGKASWGHLDFQLGGQSYSLLTASPITGGDQPRIVWVSNDRGYVPPSEQSKRGFLGARKLSDQQ